jgi:hypothetical protein
MQSIADRLRDEMHLLAVVIVVEDGPAIRAEAAAGTKEVTTAAQLCF